MQACMHMTDHYTNLRAIISKISMQENRKLDYLLVFKHSNRFNIIELKIENNAIADNKHNNSLYKFGSMHTFW